MWHYSMHAIHLQSVPEHYPTKWHSSASNMTLYACKAMNLLSSRLSRDVQTKTAIAAVTCLPSGKKQAKPAPTAGPRRARGNATSAQEARTETSP